MANKFYIIIVCLTAISKKSRVDNREESVELPYTASKMIV